MDLQRQTLHELSGLSQEEATRRLLEMLDTQLQKETGAVILAHEKRLAETCEQKTREVLLTSIQRYAAAHTAETTTSTVGIPNDEMKGRIIGREGRNIRAFEKATGVDVIIDDTPGVVIVSAFDMIRREVARLSLEQADRRRPHPSHADRGDRRRHAAGAGAAHPEAGRGGLPGGRRPRAARAAGQPARAGSTSAPATARTCCGTASKWPSSPACWPTKSASTATLARRCGLLHDIGKAADHEAEGGHPKIGADLLKRYGERPEVIHAASGHHDDLRIDNPYTVLVSAADACSASRPGARRETLERYVKRMEELESIASKFPGVEQAYAIQAGRELRVMVSAKETTDEIGRQDLPRHRPGLRATAHLSRRDQGHRAAGDPARGDGPLTALRLLNSSHRPAVRRRDREVAPFSGLRAARSTQRQLAFRGPAAAARSFPCDCC